MADEEEPKGDAESTAGTTDEPDGGATPAGSDVKVGRLDDAVDSADGVDVASLLNHVTYVAVAFAATGAGFGLLVFLMSQFGADATVLPGQQQSQASFVTNFISTGLTIALYVPLFLAPLVGFVVDLSVEDEVTSLVAAFFGTMIGAVLLYMIAGGLGDMQYVAVQTVQGSMAPSFDVAAGAVDSVMVGIVAGGVAGLSAVAGRAL